MSSRLRQAYVAASCGTSKGLTTRARHSEATAACSSAFSSKFESLVGRHSRTTQLVPARQIVYQLSTQLGLYACRAVIPRHPRLGNRIDLATLS
jgi:hypothetical protein